MLLCIILKKFADVVYIFYHKRPISKDRFTGPLVSEVEPPPTVRKVVGSSSGRDIPKGEKDGISSSLAYFRHQKMSAGKYGWSDRCQLQLTFEIRAILGDSGL